MIFEHFRDLAAATDGPVNADFENSCADDSETAAKDVRRRIAVGVAVLSVEDLDR